MPAPEGAKVVEVATAAGVIKEPDSKSAAAAAEVCTALLCSCSEIYDLSCFVFPGCVRICFCFVVVVCVGGRLRMRMSQNPKSPCSSRKRWEVRVSLLFSSRFDVVLVC